MNDCFKSLFVQLQLPCPNCHKDQSCPSTSNHRHRKSSSESSNAGKNIRIVTQLTVPPAKISSARIEQQPRHYASGECSWRDLDFINPPDIVISSTGDNLLDSSEKRQGIVVPLTPAVHQTPPGHPGDIESPESAVPLEEFGVRRGQISPECPSPSSPFTNSSVGSSPIGYRSNRPHPRSPQLFNRPLERHLAGRGVLLDWRWHALCRGIEYSPFSKYSITIEELKAIASYSGIEFTPGDILLVRTGWMAEFITLTDVQKEVVYKSDVGECCGVENSEDSTEWHRDMGFRAVITDSRKYEVWPPPLPPERALSEVHRLQCLRIWLLLLICV